MKKITSFLLIVLSLFLFNGVIVSANDGFVETGGAGYKQIEEVEVADLDYGVGYTFYKGESLRSGITNPQQVHALEIPAKSEAKIISYANHNNHRWTLTTVTDLARKFESENPDWKVLAAVNGDFFDINGNGNLPYQTSNPLVSRGEYYKTNGSRAIGFKNDGSTTSLISGTPQKSEYMVLSVYGEDGEILEEFDVHQLNTDPGENETSVYFGTYNSSKAYVAKQVDGDSEKFVVENAELALPNNTNDFYGKGEITSNDDILLDVGQFAILSNNTEVIEALEIGTTIRVQYELVGDLAGADNVTGTNGKFLVAGEYSSAGLATNLGQQHPRTVAGIKEDGTIILSVIDGRQIASGKAGMYGDEMAAYMKSLGAVEAYNLDGGGSSYLMVREGSDFVVKSSPSDGVQRRNGNALLVAIQVPHIEVEIEQSLTSLNFNVDLINKNGYDITDLYVSIGDLNRRVVDGKTNFPIMEPNTEYFYEILYKDSTGKITPLRINGKIKTLKSDPIFNYVKIAEYDVVYTISMDFNDPHNASTLGSSTININGKPQEYKLQDNQLIILKVLLKEPIVTIDLKYEVNNNVVQEEIRIENATYRLVNSTLTENIHEMFRIQSEIILSIYS